MKAIGIDIGTTTISVVVVQTESMDVIQSRTIPNGDFIKTEREWERLQDTAFVIKKAKEVLDELLGLYDDIDSIGLTGQMHGILYLNSDGRCISPLYTWQDGRGNLAEFEGKTLVDELNERCGMRAATGYGLVTHVYNMRKNLVPAESVSFCTISDYLGMELTGRKQPLLHGSMAASLGFFNSRNMNFDREVLMSAGVNLSMLPEVTDAIAVLGEYQGVPVTTALGDNQASFFGSVGLREQTVLLNMGTGGQISVLSNQYFEVPGIEARPFIQGNYLLVGSSLCGGRAYSILERFFRRYVIAAGGEDRDQYDIMFQLAQAGERQSDGMEVITSFNGTRSNPDVRGSISNISEDNFTPENMVYGVLQGMAQELYHMYRLIQERTGITAYQMVASGNGLRKNPVLQRIFEKMFGVELTLAPCQEEAACGAAMSSAL